MTPKWLGLKDDVSVVLGLTHTCETCLRVRVSCQPDTQPSSLYQGIYLYFISSYIFVF